MGYFFPGFFAEMELSGAGFAVRGTVFPGVPLVLIGRGPDFAWSATSSQADNRDLFAETLCSDDLHYLYRGACEPMSRFFVGTLKAQGQPDQEISYYETTHGPVIGYATVGGKRVAISVQRSTRGRELLSTPAFYALDTGQVGSATEFLATMNRVEFSFNWFYADDRDIAMSRAADSPSARPAPTRRCPRSERATTTGEVRPVRRACTGDRPALRQDPQLEQPSGCGRWRCGLQLLVRLGPTRRPARHRGDPAEEHAGDTRRRHERGSDAGPSRRRVCGRR